MIWNRIQQLSKDIESLYQEFGSRYSDKEHNADYNWYNALYTGNKFRRAHIEIVDKRESHKIYILHCTVFPHYFDPSPIWGFDAVCGPNKITGAFHDFSESGDKRHPMMEWFSEKTKSITWNKPRVLPNWASSIFSQSMVAAGNIQDEEELESLCSLAIDSLRYYMHNVGNVLYPGDYHMAQNRYCFYQKQNPHVVNSMVAMGIPKEVIEKFVDEVLFPEII